jgi:phage repressor protein C with HTH and peptisase S24 domain
VALRVAGASMQPTLERGDLIIVNRADNVLGDGIFALKFGETLLVKTVVCRGKDTFDLVSDNPLYGNIHVDLTKDGDHLNVIGRVTAHWGTL